MSRRSGPSSFGPAVAVSLWVISVMFVITITLGFLVGSR